jgi:hypothetical protein
MAITASSGGASAAIEARRPSWADMKKSYPDHNVSTEDLYDNRLGGKFTGLYKNPAYENTCAVRMSYALNRSGLKLGGAPSKGGTLVGNDGYNYWIRVSDLRPELMTRFKGADEELNLNVIPSSMVEDMAAMGPIFLERKKQARQFLDTKLASRNGIVVFEVAGWGDASGHFTLWDGGAKELAYAEGHDDPNGGNYYFWLTNIREVKGVKRLIQVVKVKFWELK